MNTQRISLILALLATLMAALPAEAARLGGGKSFGSRPSYSTPYERSAPSAAPSAAPSNPSASRPTAPTPNMPNPARSGFMGMLGGLAMGGLLGGLLFGGGFHGAGLLDFILLAGLAWLAFKLFAARRQPQSASGPDYEPANAPYTRDTHNQGAGGFDTDILSRKGGMAYQPAAASVPSDFDRAAFLRGAEAAYRHLQAAWDQGDLAELRSLTTDKVFAELQDQIRARRGSNRTELLKVEMELLEVRDVGHEREATVLFDVLMRETAEERAKPVREVWHFTRSRHSAQPTWFLDGIQQIDA